MPDIGPHLLGRIPSPPDERDFRLENFLGVGAGGSTPQQLALVVDSELRKTEVSYRVWASKVYADVTQTHWFKAFDALAQIAPAPPSGTQWSDPQAVLDQGNYGTCVGNGWAQWGNCLPVGDQYVEKDARAIYYEATVIDGSPDNPDSPGGGQQGATVRAGAKAMQNRKRLSAYAFASDLSAVDTFLQSKGPLTIGSDWTNDMFNPDAQGLVKPTGGVAGGHCYLLLGYDATAYTFLNSWSDQWGLQGYFKMLHADFASLFSNQGEAVAAVELP